MANHIMPELYSAASFFSAFNPISPCMYLCQVFQPPAAITLLFQSVLINLKETAFSAASALSCCIRLRVNSVYKSGNWLIKRHRTGVRYVS